MPKTYKKQEKLRLYRKQIVVQIIKLIHLMKINLIYTVHKKTVI